MKHFQNQHHFLDNGRGFCREDIKDNGYVDMCGWKKSNSIHLKDKKRGKKS